jgi:2-oxoglutarate dehydrogenase E2 component (dihydrolipoamide succinyltransferase)
MATIDVIMPQMGESIAEGTLSRWIKKVGEPVKRDEPIFEISTDKVDAEIPAPAAGVLSEILVKEGETVAVQTVVAKIETEAGAAAAAAPAAPAAAPASAPSAPRPTPAATAKAPTPNAPEPPRSTPAGAPPAPVAPAPAAPPRPTPAPASAPARAVADPGANGGESAEERLRRRSTPLVRKMAAEHNLDLSAIPGTGLAGRVTKNDILSYLEAGPAAEAPAAPAPPPTAAPAAVTAPAAAAPSPTYAPSVEAWPGDRVEPWSRIRKLTAEHMVMSRRVSPHVNTIFEIDYTRVAQLRARKKQEYADRGVNLTYLAFIAKAVADALRRHPTVNAAVSGESTVLRRDINLGIAVALDWGLIVPVIKHADELSLIGIARAINDLGERARTKKLSPDDVQRGTFTITNPGVFGSVIGTPIINQPQAAILCVGAIEKQPAVITVDGSDTLAIRTRGMLSLAFDHRIVDGADADRFMAEVKRALQEFPDGAV